ncbi:MAG: polysaccharide lyase [Polyangiaceae bacterium]|nr:polysaccharide lyase [Polyangiaceae bacterium]
MVAFAAGVLVFFVFASGCSVEERPFAPGTGGAGGAGSAGGDGGGGSAGGGGGGPDVCAAGFACDNFESYPIKAEPLSPFSPAIEAGEVYVDDTRAYSGKQSVRLSTGATDGFKAAMLHFNDPSKLPTPENVVYGRMMFWLESAPANEVQWSFIVGSGTVSDPAFGGYTALYRYGGQLPVVVNGNFVGSQLMANYDTPGSYENPPVGPATDCWHHASGNVVPVGKWTCVEFHFNGPTNEMQIWLDGAELPDLHVEKSGQGCTSQPGDYVWLAPSFSDIFVGWESYILDEPRTIWIDDLAIGAERLGCP